MLGLGLSLTSLLSGGGHFPGTPVDFLGSSLKGWWSADDHGTANMVDDGGGRISSWRDRISGITPTATDAQRPIWSATSFNGKPGVTGDGIKNFMKTTAFTALPTGATPGEIWIVANTTSTTDNASWIHYGQIGGASRNVNHDTIFRIRVSDGTVSLIASAPLISGNCIIGAQFYPAIMAARINGAYTTGPVSSAITLNTLSSGALTLFSHNNSVIFNAATIRHVIVTTLLTLSQRELLEGWLAWDSGIASVLPAYHPYKSGPALSVRRWRPGDLGSSLACWWNADDHGTGLMTDDGAGLLSSWRDRVAYVNPVAATTARPTWGTSSFNSSYSGVVSSGVNVMLLPSTTVIGAPLTAIPVGSTPGEIWMVLNSTNVTNGLYMFAYGSAGGVIRGLLHDNTPGLKVTDSSASLAASSPIFTGNMIAMGYWSGTTQGMRQNGADTVPATGIIGSLSTPAGGPLSIFARNTSAQFAPITLRHAFITTLLTAGQRQQLEGWAAWDSGMADSLPASHTYKNAPPYI